MREIKFRAWNNAENKMLDCSSFMLDCKSIWLKMNDKMMERAYDLELMQYTGLKDKNSVEIYEGDIVIFRDKEKFVVEYNNERAEYRAFYYKIEDRDIYTERLISDRYEVIDNICENEKLLNV